MKIPVDSELLGRILNALNKVEISNMTQFSREEFLYARENLAQILLDNPTVEWDGFVWHKDMDNHDFEDMPAPTPSDLAHLISDFKGRMLSQEIAMNKVLDMLIEHAQFHTQAMGFDPNVISIPLMSAAEELKESLK